MKRLFTLLLVGMQLSLVYAQNNLDSIFCCPPDEAKPVVWWRWMGSQISKDGITADLEALKAVGLGGVVHFQVSAGINDAALWTNENTRLPKVKTLSSEWWNMMKHAIDESDRLGLSFRMQNCLGYSTNGGPWIKPEQAMQKLVWTDTIITLDKNRTVMMALEQPEVHKPIRYYQDIAVLAIKLSDSDVVSLSDIHDITKYVKAGEIAGWKADAGRWQIIRYGYTPTGVMPHPVDNYVNGLECDKMSREAITTHFTNYVKKILDIAGDKAGRTVEAVVLDSYEAGGQTWTPRFREKFIEKRGYDPLYWLPTFGKGEIRGSKNSSLDWIPPVGELIVENRDLTERFRYDFYKTIEELVLEENIAALTELSHRYPDVKFELQPYNAPYNFVRGGRMADRVSGEFWHGNSSYGWWTLRLAASVAHITKNPIVYAEAFTASPSAGNWDILPEDMKAEADLAFSLGVNAFQLHVMPHQPWDDSVFPGMVSQSWGTQLNRHNSWWTQSKAWNEYLTRVQGMLRQGEAVADVAYLYPTFQKTIPVADGYNCDAMDETFMQEHVYADAEGLVLDNGRRYKLLVLPDNEAMSLSLVKKIAALVKDGACIVGPRPLKSSGLSGYPTVDSEIQKLSAEVWGDCDGTNVRKHKYGKGTVYCGMSVAEVMKDMAVEKDLEILAGGNSIVWTHRKTADADIYFVANQSRKPVGAEILFRVAGMLPEIWDAEKGTTTQKVTWEKEDGRTKVSLELESLQSLFVIFRKQTKDTGSGKSIDVSESIVSEIAGPWKVLFKPVKAQESFEVNMDSLYDWTISADKRLKYFSGTATYSKNVHLIKKEIKDAQAVYLDLGKVGGIVSLKINGREVAVLWKHPFKADITRYVKPGKNVFEIEVTNTLTNCLIGDEQYPLDIKFGRLDYAGKVFRGRWLLEYPKWLYTGDKRPTERKTFTTYNYYRQDSPLLPSGLLGDKIRIIVER